MFLQGLYGALLSWRNSHVGSAWSWYMMWPGQIFFRSPEQSNFLIGLAVVRRWRFTRLYYFADHDLHDRVISPITIYVIMLFLVGPGFEPRPNSTIFFIGPGFNSQARLPVSGQCDSWPMSLTPTNGELGWWEKNLMGGKKHEVTTVSVRLRWRGRLSIDRT